MFTLSRCRRRDKARRPSRNPTHECEVMHRRYIEDRQCLNYKSGIAMPQLQARHRGIG